MHVSTGAEADLLGTDAPEVGRRPSRALVLAVCLAAVLVALLQRQEATPEPAVEVVGSMFFGDLSSRTVELPFADSEDRDAIAIGSVELELPDRRMRGDARLEFGSSREQVDGKDVVVHAWGYVRLRFGAVFCRGWFGWSNYVQPLEGGGSLHARCEDGSTLMARLVATPQPQAIGVAVDFEDAWWTPGS